MTVKKKKPKGIPLDGTVSGRPIEYDPEYHPIKVLEESKRPHSMAGLAVVLGIAKDTLYEWGKKYPIFSDSLKTYRTALEAALIDKGQEFLVNSKDKSSAVWAMMMKNMAGWKDKDDSEYKAEAEAQAQAQVKYSKALTREERIALARRKK